MNLANVETIDYQAFYQCYQLNGLISLNKVKSIGVQSFYRCRALQSVKISSNSIELIESQTFYECSNLSDFAFPPNLKTIQDMAFYQCSSLKSLSFPQTLQTINVSAFQYCQKLEIFNVVDSLSYIGSKAFYDTALQCGIIKSPDKINLFKDAVPLHSFSECPKEEPTKRNKFLLKLFTSLSSACFIKRGSK